MTERPHQKLEVYGLAHQLGLRVHAMTLKLPEFELYEEGSQIRRSSKSVSAQIVEGHALRRYKPEYVHYLARAYASAEETIEHLTYLQDTGSAAPVVGECQSLIQEYAVLARKLFRVPNKRGQAPRDRDENAWKIYTPLGASPLLLGTFKYMRSVDEQHDPNWPMGEDDK